MASPALPSDILFEILTRIPSLETLGRSRLVSKDWNRITNELSFLELLCERTSTISGFFIQSAMIDGSQVPTFVPVNQNPKLNLKSEDSELLDFLPVPAVKIEAVSQGIVFCMNRNYSKVPQYFVCKPTTKQWEKIPNPNTSYKTITTAMVLLSSKIPLIRYKIVRFSKPKSGLYSINLKCEVFDSNTWVWKQLNKDVYLPYDFPGEPVVSACGAFHWLLDDNKIFAFHYNKETWEIFYLPQLVTRDFPSYVEQMRLVEYKHRLALLIFRGKDVMALSVMEDHEKKVWSRRKTLMSIEGLNECERYEAYLVGGLYNNDSALMKGSNKIILYKFQDSSLKVLRLENQPDQIFEFLSDFNSVSLKCLNLSTM